MSRPERCMRSSALTYCSSSGVSVGARRGLPTTIVRGGPFGSFSPKSKPRMQSAPIAMMTHQYQATMSSSGWSTELYRVVAADHNAELECRGPGSHQFQTQPLLGLHRSAVRARDEPGPDLDKLGGG